MIDVETSIREAIRESTTVGIHHRSGRRYVGVPSAHPTDTEYFVIHLGGRSGTREVHFDDVLEVSVEC